MRVLVACEFSGVVRDAFRRRGHQAFSCDLVPSLPSIYSDYHLQGDVLQYLNYGWDLMIAHPDCTYLTNAGVRHLYDDVMHPNHGHANVYGQARWSAMIKAAEFFNLLKSSSIPRIAIENPIPHKYARERIGYYSQVVQPWQFGIGETKATCLWLKDLPLLKSTSVVEGRKPVVHYESPGNRNGLTRKQRCSVTCKGIANAMADQWGHLG